MAGFSIYPRKRKNGKPVYYAQFKKSDSSYTTAKSTGCSTKRAAEAWCEDNLLKFGTPLSGREITFEYYSNGFFDWSGKWATDRRVEGKRLGQRHCRDRADIMRLHILPVFGSLKLSEIDKTNIKDFRNSLFEKGYSGSVINKCLYAIKTVLEFAEDEGFIQAVPKIIRAADNTKQKGILTINEANSLFSFQWMSKPSYSHPSKPQFMGFVGNQLAASTGLRLGELQGITIQDLHLDDGYITIKRSWDNRLKKLNTTTKTGRERNIFIPQIVVESIRMLLNLHPAPNNPESFLFYGEKKPEEKPAEQIVFVRSLFTAMECIGIDKTERKNRNITFHSWRHWFNSLLINAKIPLQKIQSITGHMTMEMTQHYYHIDDMQDVKIIQEGLFSFSNKLPTDWGVNPSQSAQNAHFSSSERVQ